MFFLAKRSKIWMLHFAKFCSYSWNKGDILWSKARALSHFDVLKFLKLRCTVSLWPIQPLFLREFICMVHTKMFINLIHLYLWRSQLYESQQIISVQHTVRSGGWKGCGITLLTFVFFLTCWRQEQLFYQWINPQYLNINVQSEIQDRFEAESEIELQDFINVSSWSHNLKTSTVFHVCLKMK